MKTQVNMESWVVNGAVKHLLIQKYLKLLGILFLTGFELKTDLEIL